MHPSFLDFEFKIFVWMLRPYCTYILADRKMKAINILHKSLKSSMTKQNTEKKGLFNVHCT